MEQLLEKSASLAQRISTEKKHYLYNEIFYLIIYIVSKLEAKTKPTNK